MLKVLFLFLLLMVGLIVGPIIAGHQGYVLIQTDNWNIETSVTGVVIILTLTLLAILVLEWLLRRFFRSSARMRGWFFGRKHRQARQQMREALIKLTEGDHHQVEKLLSRNPDHAEQPMVNYLLAAEAAQKRKDELRANQYLERASELAQNDRLPIEITRVRLQLARDENHAARRGVDHLLDVAPHHPEVLRLAEQAYLRTDAWSSLLDILPAIQKTQVAGETHCAALRHQAFIGLMKRIMADQGSDGLKRWWQDQSRKTRREIALQVAIAEHLMECNDHEAAQTVVLEGLKHHFDERLVLLIPQLKSDTPKSLEKALNQQIKQQGTTPLIHSILGQLFMKQGKWLQASDAFREALKQRPDAFDFAWLADSFDKQHKPEEATQMRREGLLLSLKPKIQS